MSDAGPPRHLLREDLRKEGHMAAITTTDLPEGMASFIRYMRSRILGISQVEAYQQLLREHDHRGEA